MHCVLNGGHLAMDKTAVLFDAEENYTTCQLVQVLSNLVTYTKVHIRKKSTVHESLMK